MNLNRTIHVNRKRGVRVRIRKRDDGSILLDSKDWIRIQPKHAYAIANALVDLAENIEERQ